MRRFVFFFLALAGCAVLEPEPLAVQRRALVEARARWERARPRAYRYMYTPQCSCPSNYTRAVWVSVQDSVVTRVAYVDGYGPALVGTVGFPTIDGLFARLDSAYAAPVPDVRVRYDGTWGYPAEAVVRDDGFAASALDSMAATK